MTSTLYYNTPAETGSCAMSDADQRTVTRLLAAWREGDRQALDTLFPLVYEELCGLAHRQRRDWHGDYTVNTTALVHEAYLKLVDQARAGPESRAHFFALAAKAMRHILSNYAKHRRRKKRGGDVQKISLDADKVAAEDVLVMTDDRAEALIALDEALARLDQVDERQSRVVECRFYGRMTVQETAMALGVSPATVKRDWSVAQAWLYREMRQTLQA